MGELFVSYSHSDRTPVAELATRLEHSGHLVWWDRQLTANQDFGREIEAALARSGCAVVAWSARARDSLWVRAEASAAWEAGKLVQVSLDGARPPLPFTMVHLLDLSAVGSGQAEKWIQLDAAVLSVLRGEPPADSAAVAGTRTTASTLGTQVAVGGASIVLIVLASCLVLAATSLSVSTSVFGFLTMAMFLGAASFFVYMLVRLISVFTATR
jgi:hypothetical protein